MSRETALYASIYKPTQVRKGLLLTVRDTVTILKRSDRLNHFAAEKVKMTSHLRDTLGELRVLVQRAKTMMPTTSDAPFAQPKPQRDFAPPTKRTIVKSKIDFIEQELDRIEGRLQSLQD